MVVSAKARDSMVDLYRSRLAHRGCQQPAQPSRTSVLAILLLSSLEKPHDGNFELGAPLTDHVMWPIAAAGGGGGETVGQCSTRVGRQPLTIWSLDSPPKTVALLMKQT